MDSLWLLVEKWGASGLPRFNSYMPYMWADRRFYRPYGSDLERGDLESMLLEIFDSDEIVRGEFWVRHAPREIDLPPHGWKIHIAATPLNVKELVPIVSSAARSLRFSFKVPRSTEFVYSMHSRWWPTVQVGKTITIYPSDTTHALRILEHLHSRTRQYRGTYVLTDRRYKDSECLCYRYGGFTSESRVRPDGTYEGILLGPKGEEWPDRRTPQFSVPPWAIGEDSGWHLEVPVLEGQSTEVRLGKYRVTKVIRSGGLGGTYEATNGESGDKVILKEARALTGFDPHGDDAQDRLRKEHATLMRLKGTGVAPEPREIFEHGPNLYMVEEFVPGVPLVHFVAYHNPMVRGESAREYETYRETFRVVTENIEKAIASCHENGFNYGDLSLTNVLVNEDTLGVRLVDFEFASPRTEKGGLRQGTPGFTPPVGWEGDVDSFGVAACKVALIIPRNTLMLISGATLAASTRLAYQDLGIDASDALKTMQLEGAPQSVPSVSEVLHEAGRFTMAMLSTKDPRCLLPADPQVYETNAYSLMHGIAGPAMVFRLLDVQGWEELAHQLEEAVDVPQEIPPGLFYGKAGVALSLGVCGRSEVAKGIMEDLATELRNGADWPGDLATGAAGVGFAAAKLFAASQDSLFLDIAERCAVFLDHLETDDGSGLRWPSGDGDSRALGWAHGSSGVAQFMLFLGQVSNHEGRIMKGFRGLERDLSRVVNLPSGQGFPVRDGSNVYTPYLLAGSAGLGMVAAGYASVVDDQRVHSFLERLADELSDGVGISSGLLRGMAGVLEFQTTAQELLGIGSSTRTVESLCSLACREEEGVAYPGDPLTRYSCDLATGSSGVMLALGRSTAQTTNPLLLDVAGQRVID